MSDNSPSTITRRDALRWLSLAPLVSLGVQDNRGAQVPAASTPTDDALAFLGARELGQRIAARELSPVEVTQFMLDRIARIDPHYKSYATVMSEQALRDARVAEREIQTGRRRSPLHGVPIAIKDLCYTKGVRTMGGCGAFRDFVPEADGTVVEKLRAAGAVILGKLNLTEGAMAGYNPAFDVPLNPWDRSRWPGISSSGSGVATAAGLCYASIGTDTGGSIRFPSSANGVVGLKPTYGRVSRFGVLPFAESLDHVGPMARRVADVAVMLEAIAGRDDRDATSLHEPVPSISTQLGQSIAGLRIGIDRGFAFTKVDPGQVASIEAALEVFRRLGARIVDVEMPALTGVGFAWFVLASSEAALAHARTYPSQAEKYGPYIRDFLDAGRAWKPEQIATAGDVRKQFTAQFSHLLGSVDAMVCPAGGSPAWVVTHELQVGRMQPLSDAWAAALPRFDEFTGPLNLAGTPSITLPSGFSTEGLPLSIQIAGARSSEPVLCRIAHAYEEGTAWHGRHPRLV